MENIVAGKQVETPIQRTIGQAMNDELLIIKRELFALQIHPWSEERAMKIEGLRNDQRMILSELEKLKTVERIAVLAGSHQQFKYFLNEKQISERSLACPYFYVTDVHKLRGIEIDRFEIVGTFWQRGDAANIYDQTQLSLKRKK